MYPRRLLLVFHVLLVALLVAPGHASAWSWSSELGSAKPAAVGLSEERLGRIRLVLRDHVKEGRIAGAVVLLARHGKARTHSRFAMACASRRPITSLERYRPPMSFLTCL